MHGSIAFVHTTAAAISPSFSFKSRIYKKQKRPAVKSYLPRRTSFFSLCGSIFVSLRILLGNMLAAPAVKAHRRFPITYYSKGLSPRIRRAARKRMTDAAAAPRFYFFTSCAFSTRLFIVLIKPRAGSTCALKFGKIWRQQKVTRSL